VTLAARLPEYPWDELAPIAEKARSFPGGAVDLSVGTPVDPVPAVIQNALTAKGWHGNPTNVFFLMTPNGVGHPRSACTVSRSARSVFTAACQPEAVTTHATGRPSTYGRSSPESSSR